MYIKASMIQNDDRVLAKFPVIIKGFVGLSVHDVELCVTKDQQEYYVFNYVSGTSAINFTKTQYEQLERIIPIDNISIFYRDLDRTVLHPVSPSYRE